MSDEEARVLVPEPDPWSQLKAENEELFEMSQRDRRALEVCRLQQMTTEATMREVAEELRWLAKERVEWAPLGALADRLDPPPVEYKDEEYPEDVPYDARTEWPAEDEEDEPQDTSWQARAETAEATMREVAEELRASYERHGLYHAAHRLADCLDPPPVVENPPNTP